MSQYGFLEIGLSFLGKEHVQKRKEHVQKRRDHLTGRG